MTSEEKQMIDNAKVEDVWYVHHWYGMSNDTRKTHVVKVTKTQIHLACGERISKKFGRGIGASTYRHTSYYPGTPENVAEFEQRIQRQKLESEFRLVLDSLIERHREGKLANDDYSKLITLGRQVLGSLVQ